MLGVVRSGAGAVKREVGAVKRGAGTIRPEMNSHEAWCGFIF